VTLLLWQEVYDGLVDPAALVRGAVVRAEGEVGEYQGELEIVPRAPVDVAVVGQIELPVRHVVIGQITTGDVGQTVQVGGQIVDQAPFSEGMKFKLDDGTGSITLLLWQNVYNGFGDRAALSVGDRVSVCGEVSEYQGDLEIVPPVPYDVAVLGVAEIASIALTERPQPDTASTQAATGEPTSHSLPTSTTPFPTPTHPPQPRILGSITAKDVGTVVTVAEAGVTEVGYLSKGVRYTLTDGSGQIILLLWQNVMEGLADRHLLFPGSRVKVTGRIDEYQGELEIVPRWGTEVTVLNRDERLPVEARSVRNITPADEGRVFVVEGQVARVEGGRWLQLWLDDGTGEILIFVPERVVAYLPTGIGPGVRLRVTGEVDIYRGQIEIIPPAGNDVEVAIP
jgi:DNA/RNA endonuclease YhcR with UshA esterase domain